jgi:hypothetical protein
MYTLLLVADGMSRPPAMMRSLHGSTQDLPATHSGLHLRLSCLQDSMPAQARLRPQLFLLLSSGSID